MKMKINSYLNLALWGIFLSLFLFTKPSHQASTNRRLLNAYKALQAWKETITSDPKGLTSNWYGPNVCNYTGVFCAPALDNPYLLTVAGIDLNHGDIAGELPEMLGLLKDLALFHINSNRFCGTVPDSFRYLKLLFELDVSNNLLYGEFPPVLLSIPSLRYLDIRFNGFFGKIPRNLFDLKLDALFINSNSFDSNLPKNIGNSPVSVMVLANNGIQGCLPPGISKMRNTLNGIILMNTSLGGCLPEEIGTLKEVNVFDVSFNNLVGELPDSIGDMKKLEQFNVANNKLSGDIPDIICSLPKLENFTFSNNFFSGEPKICLKLPDKDDKRNCIPNRPAQRSDKECKAFDSRPVVCGVFGCSPRSPPPSPPRPRYHHNL